LKIVLVSTYELGHQPLGLASPQAWLVRAGHEVTAVDLAKNSLSLSLVKQADAVAFSLPMHTATRLALPWIERVRRANPSARIACYGLYAPLNADLLKEAGAEAVIGGEYEQALVDWASGKSVAEISLDKLQFLKPDRAGLTSDYARLRQAGERKAVAYVEASRGCKHLCRHCPIVPVYEGQFRVVQRDIVMEDLRQQIASGARHVTFGDPDFFNGPSHAMRIVEALHAEFPQVTYDATIKVEHLLKHRDLLRPLKETGCLFVVAAVESLDDAVLRKLEKGHTRADFFEAVKLTCGAGLSMQPTFLAFTPWTTLSSYRELLRAIRDLQLVESVASVQLALRLLITSNSRLLELEDIRAVAGPFNKVQLVHPWTHTDPAVDALGARVFRLVDRLQKQSQTRTQIFAAIWEEAGNDPLPESFQVMPRIAEPYLDEPWYC